MSGALLIAGTTSDAGKSVVTAGLCRWLSEQGVRVAPFKAQNMSLNSFVTLDGAEIGRAQAMQAAAARIEPEAQMNPVLLKPGSDRTSQVVVRGRVFAEVDAVGYRSQKETLLEIALESLDDLRSRFEIVICEGAGSAAEINLRATDIANMGLARAANLPTLIVGDIDRGGVFAGMFGTLALLSREDQALVAGFIVNKFRGAPELLTSGLQMLQDLTGRSFYGVLPWRGGLWLDVEDSLAMDVPRDTPTAPIGADALRVAVVRFPRLSNVTDIDALAAEPGVIVRFASTPVDLMDADLVVLPGTRATVADLAWLRAQKLESVIKDRARRGQPVLGLCGGYQMLGARIVDPVESGYPEPVEALGLLPVVTAFMTSKVLGRPRGTAPIFGGVPVAGYEIHHGRMLPYDGEALIKRDDGEDEGLRVGSVMGTVWHGALENDDFRRSVLKWVAELSGRDFTVGDEAFAAVREARLNSLGRLVADNLDTDAIWRLLDKGVPEGLPFVPPGMP
ncbi:MAG: cobyric acid synthase [Actinomycetota bacterium]